MHKINLVKPNTHNSGAFSDQSLWWEADNERPSISSKGEEERNPRCFYSGNILSICLSLKFSGDSELWLSDKGSFSCMRSVSSVFVLPSCGPDSQLQGFSWGLILSSASCWVTLVNCSPGNYWEKRGLWHLIYIWHNFYNIQNGLYEYSSC